MKRNYTILLIITTFCISLVAQENSEQVFRNNKDTRISKSFNIDNELIFNIAPEFDMSYKFKSSQINFKTNNMFFDSNKESSYFSNPYFTLPDYPVFDLQMSPIISIKYKDYVNMPLYSIPTEDSGLGELLIEILAHSICYK